MVLLQLRSLNWTSLIQLTTNFRKSVPERIEVLRFVLHCMQRRIHVSYFTFLKPLLWDGIDKHGALVEDTCNWHNLRTASYARMSPLFLCLIPYFLHRREGNASS